MRRRPQTCHPPRFTTSEIKEMEKSFLKAEEACFDKNFCERIAKEINHASSRAGKRTLHWKQIRRWFQNKQKSHRKENRGLAFDIIAKELFSGPEVNLAVRSSKRGSDMSTGFDVGKIDKIGVELEARSSRDGAWYDIDTIISHKYLDSGELEALVHYMDFGPHDNEWVNVKKSIRQRSIPIDSTECHTVSAGDHIVCYWEQHDRACHFDAHILDIQRKMHDIRGCRCRFLVQYDHDKSQETVHLERICRRP